MNLRKTLISGVLASSFALSGGMALAQDSTPAASPEASPAVLATPGPDDVQAAQVGVFDQDGKIIGYAQIWEGSQGVTFTLTSTADSSLAAGEHGVHIHGVGVCDASGDEPFSSAEGHFNPTDEHHGDLGADPSHAGDLGNMTVGEDGSFTYQVTTDKLTLDPNADNSLFDADGSAIVIHEDADDLATDPSGESGARIACGVIADPLPTSASPAATPAASPEATPSN